MDFKLTSDQQELQKVAREFAVNELTSLADEMEESASPVPKETFKKNWRNGLLGCKCSQRIWRSRLN